MNIELRDILTIEDKEYVVSSKMLYKGEKYIYLVMEYYKGGDLFTYIYGYYKNKKKISEKNVAKI